MHSHLAEVVTERSQPFLQLMFDGGRFANHAVPVDVLGELETVQQLLARVARTIFFRNHPDRQRVPRGFQEAAQLFLVSSEANCFTATLERPGPWASNVEDVEIFASARDLSVRALAAIDSGGNLPDEFPREAIDLLAALGQRLEREERLLVRTSRDGSIIALVDHRSRGRLAEITRRPLEREEGVDGEVEKVDDAADRFTLRTRAGDRIEVPFLPAQRSTVMEALMLRPIARIRVRGLLAVAQRLRMREVEELEVIDDERAPEVQRLWNRLDVLRDLSDGWLEGDGLTPDTGVIARVREVLARLLVDHRDIPKPSIFPTPDGGIQVEWVIGRWAAEICFDAGGDGLLAEATNADTGEEREEGFPAGQVSADSATALSGWLAALR